MKNKIIAWIKAYIVDRWFGGAKRKADAKVKRQLDKVKALETKSDIAAKNTIKAVEDLEKTIDEIQSEEDF